MVECHPAAPLPQVDFPAKPPQTVLEKGFNLATCSHLLAGNVVWNSAPSASAIRTQATLSTQLAQSMTVHIGTRTIARVPNALDQNTPHPLLPLALPKPWKE